MGDDARFHNLHGRNAMAGTNVQICMAEKPRGVGKGAGR
jgi:hypothetical protein